MSISFSDADELKAGAWQDIGYIDQIESVEIKPAKEYSLDDPVAAKVQGWSFSTGSWKWTTQPGDIYAASPSFGATWTSEPRLLRVAAPHECPHCFRQRHPEPLTATQARMYDNHTFDPKYNAAEDSSRIVCIGADYQGPAVPSGSNYTWTPTIVLDTSPVEKLQVKLSELDKLWKSLSLDEFQSFTAYTWLPGDNQYLPVGEPEKCPTDPDKLPIKFNDPENWKPRDKPKKEWYPVSPALDIKWEQWQESFPVPDAPGYDFSKFNKELSPPKKGRKK